MSEPPLRAVIVEDEPQIRRFVRTSLEAEGWQVHEAETIRQGLIEAGTRRPDLLIVDLGLPDGNGVELIRDLRSWSSIPVIVLSARTAEAEKIEALDAGADDYLTKPFSVAELLARVRANLRRHQPSANAGASTVRFGDVEIDFATRTVSRAGVAVHLTPIEFRLIGMLTSNAGRVLTHRQLLREVWGPAHADSNHYLRVYIGHLRQKLEQDPAQPRHLLTESGVGYRFLL